MCETKIESFCKNGLKINQFSIFKKETEDPVLYNECLHHHIYIYISTTALLLDTIIYKVW
jgi:hypothetical protein